jgi:methyl-accepting chemotaxis protein
MFTSLTLQGYSTLEFNTKNNQANSLDIIDQRVSSIVDDINTFPRSASNDILFLSKLFSLIETVDSGKSWENKLKDLKSSFLEFSKENTAYYQLRYINEFGDEIIKVEYDGENHYIVPDNELQNKKDRGYFKESMKLDEDEVYISRLDLNIEHGVFENRGTEEDPVYVPVIRYATPFFNNYGEKKGIIVSNIYADYFLEEIRRSGREGEQVFLINNEGYYLANSDRSKEFGFLTGREDNFYNDFPEIIKDDLVFDGRSKVETDNFIFTFGYIYPTTSSFEIHKGSEKIFGNNSEEDYYWVLVSVSGTEEMKKMNSNLKTNYLFSLLFYGLIILIIIVLIFISIFKIKNGRRK